MLDVARSNAVAASLDLELREVGICRVCLFLVTSPLQAGEERKLRCAVTSVAPVLWAEGLALPLLAALERARLAHVVDADEAIVDVEKYGPGSRVVEAVVLRLAGCQVEEMRAPSSELRRAPVIPLRPRAD